jgi:hypothetical protein
MNLRVLLNTRNLLVRQAVISFSRRIPLREVTKSTPCYWCSPITCLLESVCMFPDSITEIIFMYKNCQTFMKPHTLADNLTLICLNILSSTRSVISVLINI